MKRLLLPCAAALALAGALPARAVPTCSLGAGNLGLASVSCSLVGTTLTISETWNSAAAGSVQISGLDIGVSYTVVKEIQNQSGVSWDRMAIELLDPLGDANDALDVGPYPGFVPAGYSTSNDSDGLSFAQGFGIARVSSVFADVVADELTDARDFLDFSNGSWTDGLFGTIQFGLVDQGLGGSVNQPLLLVQRPNESSTVPEPSTALITGLALAGLTASRRQGVRTLHAAA